MPRKIAAFYLCYQIWLERQYVNQTFEQDDIECDVQEIRELLAEDKPSETKEPE
jgi:hypothetical protein